LRGTRGTRGARHAGGSAGAKGVFSFAVEGGSLADDPVAPCAVSQCPWRATRIFGGKNCVGGKLRQAKSAWHFVCFQQLRQPDFARLR